MVRELAQFDIDVTALNETRCAREGQLTEHGDGYTVLFEKEKPKTQTPL